MLAALAAGCAHREAAVVPPPTVAVSVTPVRTIAFRPRLELSGSVTASRQATVGAAAAGRVTAMFVQTGDAVDAGQPIARIDDAAYRAGFAQARGSAGAAAANVAAARAEASAASARLGLAETTARRMAQLYAEGAIARQEADEADAGLAAARAAFAQAQAGIGAALGASGAAQAAVRAAAVPLGDVVVRAPFAGVVLARAVDPGAVVGAGSPIATIEDDRHLELDVTIPDASAGSVRPGMPVTVALDALAGRAVTGTVRAIVPAASAATRSVVALIDLPPVANLYAGMYARVDISGVARAARAVPADAVVTRAGQDGVFAIAGGRASFVPVQTGATQAGWVELRDLPADVDRVALAGVERLADATPVRVGP